MNKFIKNIVLWGGVLLLQLLLLFYFRPTEHYVPYIYMYMLIGLPLHFSRVKTLFIAFLLGILIDIFCNSFGVHAFSAVFVAYITPSVASLFINLYGDETKIINPTYTGWINYILILIVLLFVYHLLVVFLWQFSLSDFWNILYQILISTSYALGIFIVITILFSRSKDGIDG